MRKSGITARSLFAAACALACLACLSARPAWSVDTENPYPTRGRVSAMLTALFYHDANLRMAEEKFGVDREMAAFASASPSQALERRERGKVVEFAKSLIYEGGYYPKEIYALLGIRDAGVARTGRLFRQLDNSSVRPLEHPSPWEVAGRVGRSGMSGASDHWAMAPGSEGEPGLPTPGTLGYLPALAVVYAAYPRDGAEAAAQLAILKDDDMRAAPVARAAVSLLIQVLGAESHNKDAWLREAARAGADSDTEHDLRATRIKDWKYLRGEECAMGRLERAVYLWYKGGSYDAIMNKGAEMLRSRESLAYLAALTAATYGQEALPGKVINSGAADRQLMELTNDLYDLATSEAVLRVEPEEVD